MIYTSIGKSREDDPLYPVYVQFERFRAAQYSRELSDKVWRGCVKISELGYWAGGSPPYAMQRLLLDEKREPLHTLQPGQRKEIQNQRVTLVAGDAMEVAVFQRIFHEFVELSYSEYKIAEGLNTDSILSPSGRRWGAGSVLGRLQNETYVGTLLYNRAPAKNSKRPRVPIRRKSGSEPPRRLRGLSAWKCSRGLRRFWNSAAVNTTRSRCWDSCVRCISNMVFSAVPCCACKPTFLRPVPSHQLNVGLLKKLEPTVEAAFEAGKLNLQCVKELVHVKPERQAEILKLMDQCNDYSVTFVRGVVLKTPVAKRVKQNGNRTPWNQAEQKKSALLKKLQEAEQQQDFYTGLYRQYSTNLRKRTPICILTPLLR